MRTRHRIGDLLGWYGRGVADVEQNALHPEPPLLDRETGFRSGKRRSEVWCSECGAYFHFSDPHPHEHQGRKVEWPVEA